MIKQRDTIDALLAHQTEFGSIAAHLGGMRTDTPTSRALFPDLKTGHIPILIDAISETDPELRLALMVKDDLGTICKAMVLRPKAESNITT